MSIGAVVGLEAAAVIVRPAPHLVDPGPIGRAIRDAVKAQPDDPIGAFYRAHGFRPLWLDGQAFRPEAWRLIDALRRSDGDDLDPEVYHPAQLAAQIAQAGADPARLADAELALSRAYAAFARDLHQPAPSAGLQFVDPAISMPPTQPAAILADAARASSLAEALDSAQRMNPIYLRLREALAARRAHGDLGPRTRRIEVNLERARGLPVDLGQRYVLVDPAMARLWLYSDGRPKGTMRVVVGKRSLPTPSMIGLIRFALLNPYWNVPPDLVRDRIAPAVLIRGPAYLRQHHFEALSDWSQAPVSLNPDSVDWRAVAEGEQALRVRQSPGPDNMMGRIKFMLPNPLGVYLHDTSEPHLFHDVTRTDSSGCVRVEHPGWLAEWLFDRPFRLTRAGAPDQREDLPAPTPVYILYLTAFPSDRGLVYPPDIYGRDSPLETELEAMPNRDAARAQQPVSETLGV